ncbi:hypothetical protein [Plasticicumulans sp.]|uniref:hypothetical protein n=1 Tax=Plasticicumulans sp. TaxID=2307179 RepID=UPI0032205A0B
MHSRLQCAASGFRTVPDGFRIIHRHAPVVSGNSASGFGSDCDPADSPVNLRRASGQEIADAAIGRPHPDRHPMRMDNCRSARTDIVSREMSGRNRPEWRVRNAMSRLIPITT